MNLLPNSNGARRMCNRKPRFSSVAGVPTVSGVYSRRASGSDPTLLVTPLWREKSPAGRAGTDFRLQLDPDDLANRIGHLGKCLPRCFFRGARTESQVPS